MKLLDRVLEDAYNANPSVGVAWYLMTSYLYYHHDTSVLSDPAFDNLCKYLDEDWDAIEHIHKHLINREDLRAGTGFALQMDDLPLRVVAGAAALLDLALDADDRDPRPFSPPRYFAEMLVREGVGRKRKKKSARKTLDADGGEALPDSGEDLLSGPEQSLSADDETRREHDCV